MGVIYMRTRFLKFSIVIFSLFLFVSIVCFPKLKANAEGDIDGFIIRCYDIALGRVPSQAEIEHWENELYNYERCGSDTVYCFVFGNEYLSMNKNDEEFVEDMYKTFLGRDSDPDGKAFWMDKVAQGWSREQIFGGFANSDEFYNLCLSYKITAGYFDTNYNRDQVNKVNCFVHRMYDTCLLRIGDKAGQQNWVSQLLAGNITGAKCAHDFIFSDEYIGYEWDDDIFIYDMYYCLMGRYPDDGGYYTWTNAMAHDMTRDEVFEGFVNSQEFSDICARYGIQRGDYTATDRGYNLDKLRLVNKDGIIIYVLSNYSYSNYEYKKYFEITNNTSRDLSFLIDTLSINGYMVDGYMYQEVNSGKKAVTYMWINNSALQRIGVYSYDDIKEVDVEIYATDKNYNRIWESGKLSYVYD